MLDVFENEIGIADDYSLKANVFMNLYDRGAARVKAKHEEANLGIAENNFTDIHNRVVLKLKKPIIRRNLIYLIFK